MCSAGSSSHYLARLRTAPGSDFEGCHEWIDHRPGVDARWPLLACKLQQWDCCIFQGDCPKQLECVLRLTAHGDLIWHKVRNRICFDTAICFMRSAAGL